MHKKYFSLVLLSLIALNACAQKDSVAQVDFGDVMRKIFGLKPPKADTSKIPIGKLFFSVAPAIGYTVAGSFEVSVNTNESFLTADPATTNVSVINTGVICTLNKQILFPLITNVWLPGNKYNLQGDWRIYKYPSLTYGLGGNTNLSNSDQINYSWLKVYQEILRHFGQSYYIGVGYNLDYHFNVSDNNPVTDFPQYNGTAMQTTSSGLVAHIMYDDRTNLNNPKNNLYLSLIYRYNSTLLGSDQNWQYLLFDGRKYISLSKKVVWAFWLYDEFTFGGQAPYLDLPSNGWDTYSNTGRGYIQGRFRGPDFVYGETELRLPITRNGLLGWVVFLNAENVTGWPQQSFGQFWPGYGIGLRIKFNKFSDVNGCIDYGFGAQGSQGIFFNLGEVF